MRRPWRIIGWSSASMIRSGGVEVFMPPRSSNTQDEADNQYSPAPTRRTSYGSPGNVVARPTSRALSSGRVLAIDFAECPVKGWPARVATRFGDLVDRESARGQQDTGAAHPQLT